MSDQGNSNGSPTAEKVIPAKMDAALKAKWVDALRSGDYKQCRLTLADHARGQRAFCCIGVGYQISGRDCEDIGPHDLGATVLAANALGISADQCSRLVELNDGDMKSFTEIADYIELNL